VEALLIVCSAFVQESVGIINWFWLKQTGVVFVGRNSKNVLDPETGTFRSGDGEGSCRHGDLDDQFTVVGLVHCTATVRVGAVGHVDGTSRSHTTIDHHLWVDGSVVVRVVVVHQEDVSSRWDVLGDLKLLLSVVFSGVQSVVLQLHQMDLIVSNGVGSFSSVAVDDIIGAVIDIEDNCAGWELEGRFSTSLKDRSLCGDASWFRFDQCHFPFFDRDSSDLVQVESVSGTG